MSTTQANADPFKRHRTGHRGVVYRFRSDGSRSYYVYATGRFTQIEGGEEDALARRAELRGKAVHPFSELAEEWLTLEAEASPVVAGALPRLARPVVVTEVGRSGCEPSYARPGCRADR